MFTYGIQSRKRREGKPGSHESSAAAFKALKMSTRSQACKATVPKSLSPPKSSAGGSAGRVTTCARGPEQPSHQPFWLALLPHPPSPPSTALTPGHSWASLPKALFGRAEGSEFRPFTPLATLDMVKPSCPDVPWQVVTQTQQACLSQVSLLFLSPWAPLLWPHPQ